MSATVIAFPCAASGPCWFTPEARGALIALEAHRPRWEIAFEACDNGDEWACYTDTRDLWAYARFFVSALSGGRLLVTEGHDIEHGTFATVAEAVAALRAAGV